MRTGIGKFDDPPTTGQTCRRWDTTGATAGERDECEKTKTIIITNGRAKRAKQNTLADSRRAAVSEVRTPLSVGGRYYIITHE